MQTSPAPVNSERPEQRSGAPLSCRKTSCVPSTAESPGNTTESSAKKKKLVHRENTVSGAKKNDCVDSQHSNHRESSEVPDRREAQQFQSFTLPIALQSDRWTSSVKPFRNFGVGAAGVVQLLLSMIFLTEPMKHPGPG